MADELDMTDGRDRRTLARGIASGWSITPTKLRRYVEKLDAALDVAESPRDIRSIVQTMVSIVGQVQADEHLDRKYAEAADGNAETIQRIRVVYDKDHGETDG